MTHVTLITCILQEIKNPISLEMLIEISGLDKTEVEAICNKEVYIATTIIEGDQCYYLNNAPLIDNSALVREVNKQIADYFRQITDDLY